MSWDSVFDKLALRPPGLPRVYWLWAVSRMRFTRSGHMWCMDSSSYAHHPLGQEEGCGGVQASRSLLKLERVLWISAASRSGSIFSDGGATPFATSFISYTWEGFWWGVAYMYIYKFYIVDTRHITWSLWQHYKRRCTMVWTPLIFTVSVSIWYKISMSSGQIAKVNFQHGYKFCIVVFKGIVLRDWCQFFEFIG
jgi:hypothetical protein